MKKLNASLIICFLVSFSVHGQNLMNTGGSDKEEKNSTLGNADTGASLRTSTEFGKALLSALQSGNPDQLSGLLYKREDLMATVEAQTTDMNFKLDMQKELREGFDQMIWDENQRRFYSLLNNEPINWSQASFQEFVFKQNEGQSKKMNIITGKGYLRFSYEGRNYQLLVDKVSELVSGWRGHEIGTRVELVYKNQ